MGDNVSDPMLSRIDNDTGMRAMSVLRLVGSVGYDGAGRNERLVTTKQHSRRRLQSIGG